MSSSGASPRFSERSRLLECATGVIVGRVPQRVADESPVNASARLSPTTLQREYLDDAPKRGRDGGVVGGITDAKDDSCILVRGEKQGGGASPFGGLHADPFLRV